jgi:molecular chaperone HtpG
MTAIPGNHVPLTVSLAGIIEIFGHFLFEDFGAVVRELVQNAHDGIVESVAASPAAQLSNDAINVVYTDGHLVVADSGVGMTREQIAQRLNNFAESFKRDRQKALDGDAEYNKLGLNIIGQYGVGFLAAMSPSEQIEVLSKTIDGSVCNWTWRSGYDSAEIADETEQSWQNAFSRYQIAPSASGSIVICKLKPSVIEKFGVSRTQIHNWTRHYCQILPFPVFANGAQVSGLLPAWANPKDASIRDWAETIQRLTKAMPVFTVPIYSPPDEWDIQGVMWVPARNRYTRDPHLELYVKRMFVMEDRTMFIPQWASIFVGMINCNSINRQVHGSGIMKGDACEGVRQFIEAQLLASFETLKNDKAAALKWRSLAAYDEKIKESACDFPHFMARVWDKLQIRTTLGDMYIPEYLSAVENRLNESVLYFYDNIGQEFAAKLVSESARVPIAALMYGRDFDFVRRVCTANHIVIKHFHELAQEQLPVESAPRFTALIEACARKSIHASLRNLQSSEVPAVLIEDTSTVERREDLLNILRETQADVGLINDLETMFDEALASNKHAPMYLNQSNALVQALVDASPETQENICLALYSISFMAAMPDLQKREVNTVYATLTSVFLRLLEESQKIRQSQPRTTKVEPHRLFMMVPYDEQHENVVAAVRRVFEDKPFCFDVVLGKDFNLNSDFLDHLKGHMEAADLFVADITTLNPNVLVELGSVFITNDRRPVLLLRGDEFREMPCDLQGQLLLRYGSPEDSVDEIADSIRSQIQVDGKVSVAQLLELINDKARKALTRTILKRYGRLNDTEIDAVRAAFNSIHDLLQSEEGVLVARTGLDEDCAAFVKSKLRGML